MIMCSVDVENVATALGVQEAARGVGMMIGPAVGGMLYAAGGFPLPFFASAGVLAALGIAVLFALGDDEAISGDDDEQHATFSQARARAGTRAPMGGVWAPRDPPSALRAWPTRAALAHTLCCNARLASDATRVGGSKPPVARPLARRAWARARDLPARRRAGLCAAPCARPAQPTRDARG